MVQMIVRKIECSVTGRVGACCTKLLDVGAARDGRTPDQEAPGPGFPIQSHTVRAMSPTKKRVKNIKVHVPRHNSQRIGPALTAQIETIAKEKRIRTDVRQPTNESSSVIALAIVGSHFQSTISPLLIPTIGKCLRVEFVTTYCSCRAWAAVGRRYTAVRP